MSDDHKHQTGKKMKINVMNSTQEFRTFFVDMEKGKGESPILDLDQ